MAKPVVAIIGRPNVGKSTLFNRLTGSQGALTEKQPGITRDRLYHEVKWAGQEFTLIDTGGLDLQGTGEISEGVRQQVEIALKEADVLLFLVDARSGLTITDTEIAQVVRRVNKPVILAANKVEDFKKQAGLYEFFQLGLGEPVPVSAAEGLNTGDLLDQLVAALPYRFEEDEEPSLTVKVAVVGRPNVGKSSLVNALLGEKRVMVSHIPGTTRDAIDTYLTRTGQRYMLVDTAGIRRRSKIDLPIEKYSVARSFKAIKRSHVVLVVIDALEEIAEQDKTIAGYAEKQGKACVLVVNKWDLIKQATLPFAEKVKQSFSFIPFAPVVFVSAKTIWHIDLLFEKINEVFAQGNLRIPTGSLNNLIQEATRLNLPPSHKGKRLRIFYVTQNKVQPPTFLFFVNEPELMHFSYLRYLENQLRQAYGFNGTPLRFILRKRSKNNKKSYA
ncbi:MAG: ribosome biogenesis GTPase Der [Peptococcaceae bacterium]